MLIWMKFIFWISVGMIVYSYIGYGLFLLLLCKIKCVLGLPKWQGEPMKNEDFVWPDVTLIVAAYNEEQFILEKILNTQELDYPTEKLSVIFVTDGSTDSTPDIVGNYPDILLLHQPQRKGKTAALNRAMVFVKTPFVIFCDANTTLNRHAIKNIMRHYQYPMTGGVAGEKRILSSRNADVVGEGEGIYWKYESFLKKKDAELYTVVGAAGELFSIRNSLWEPLPDDVILDDFVISLRINLKGYRIAYEPNAYAMETSSASMKDEQKRKIRISAGAFQAIQIIKPVFNVFKYPVLFFQFISHRFLRWTLVPLCFPALFVSSIYLICKSTSGPYLMVVICQFLFYIGAIAHQYLGKDNIFFKISRIPYYICFMNFSLYLGFIRYLKGGQSAIWEKAQRASIQYNSVH